MIRNKKIIFGLVGSGKTTLYRKLNEQKISYAVEIELPQSCKDDEEYEITVLYANKEAKFKIKVVAEEKFEKARCSN